MENDRRSPSLIHRVVEWIDRFAVALGLSLMALIMGFSNGVGIATAFFAASVIGYLNAFKVIRPLIVGLFAKTGERPGLAVSSVCLAGSVVLVCLGYWESLLIVTMSFVIIDAVVLRFLR